MVDNNIVTADFVTEDQAGLAQTNVADFRPFLENLLDSYKASGNDRLSSQDGLYNSRGRHIQLDENGVPIDENGEPIESDEPLFEVTTDGEGTTARFFNNVEGFLDNQPDSLAQIEASDGAIQSLKIRGMSYPPGQEPVSELRYASSVVTNPVTQEVVVRNEALLQNVWASQDFGLDPEGSGWFTQIMQAIPKEDPEETGLDGDTAGSSTLGGLARFNARLESGKIVEMSLSFGSDILTEMPLAVSANEPIANVLQGYFDRIRAGQLDSFIFLDQGGGLGALVGTQDAAEEEEDDDDDEDEDGTNGRTMTSGSATEALGQPEQLSPVLYTDEPESDGPAALIEALHQGGDDGRQAHIDLISLGRSQRTPVLQALFDAYAEAEPAQGDRLLQVIAGVLLNPHTRVRLIDRLATLAQPDNPLSQSASRTLTALAVRQAGRNEALSESAAQELERLLQGCGPTVDAIKEQLASEFDLDTTDGIQALVRFGQRAQSGDCPELANCVETILRQVLTDNSLEGLDSDSEVFAERAPLYREALAAMILNGNLDHRRIQDLPGMPSENLSAFVERVLEADDDASTEEQARITYARLFTQGGLENVLSEGALLPPEEFHAVLNVASHHLVRQSGRETLSQQQARAVVGLLAHAERVAPTDTALAGRFSAVLSEGLAGDARAVIVAALDSHVLNGDSTDSRAIASLHARTLADDSIEDRFQGFVDAARAGNPLARRALAALACGIADGDETVEPQERYSALSASIIRELATSNRSRIQTSEFLLDARSFVSEQLPGAAPYDLSLVTAANLIGGLPRNAINTDVLRAITQNFQRALTSPSSPQFDNARMAMLAIARHWNQADATLFVRNLSQASIDGLVTVAPHLAPTARQAALDELNRRITVNSPDAVHATAARNALLGAPRPESVTFRVQGDPPANNRPDSPTIDRAPLGSWPAQAEWRALWLREFGSEDQFPGTLRDGGAGAADLNAPRNEWHHAEYAALAMQHFGSSNATGLEQLRQLAYESFAFNRHESVIEYWAGTTYIDAVRRYEAARAASNSTAAHAALVDLVSLDRTIGCPSEVRDRIQIYLYGERPGFQPASHEITLAVQEWQVRQFRAQQNANSAFVNIISGNSPAEIERGLNAFAAASQEANMAPPSAEWVSRYGALRLLEIGAQQLAQPGALENAERRQAVTAALQRLMRTVTRPDLLLDSLGEGGFQGLIDNLGNATTREAALQSIQAFLGGPQIERMLNDGRSMASLPLSPTDLLSSGVLTLDRGLPQTVRDFGTYSRLRSAVDQLIAPDGASNARALANLQSLIRDLNLTPRDNALVTALGGREQLQQLLTSLGQPGQRQAALQTLDTALRTEPARQAGAPWLRDLANHPDILTHTASNNAASRLEEAGRTLRLLVNPEQVQGQADFDCAALIRSFRSAIRDSGARNAEAADAWVTAYGANLRLDEAFSTQNPAERRQGVAMALRLMLEGPDRGINHDLIQTFGGRQAVTNFVERLVNGDEATGDQAVQEINDLELRTVTDRLLREGMSFIDMAALSPPRGQGGEAATQVGLSQLLRSGAFGDADLMQAALNDLTFRQLETALSNYRSDSTEANRQALRSRLHRMLERADVARGGSQSAQQLIDRLGGTEQLNAFIMSLILPRDETAAGHARAMETRIGEAATTTLLGNMRRPLLAAPTAEWTVESMLRPGITQEQISQAIAGSRRRGDAINAAYTQAETAFLLRPEGGGVLTAQQREQALTQLEQAGVSGFGMGGNDLLLIGAPEFRAVHQLLRLQEATDADARVRELRGLIALADQGNMMALEMVRSLTFTDQGQSHSASSLLQILERGTAEEQQRAWSLMESHLPNGEEHMDQLRVRAIVREVTSTLEPTVAQLDACRTALERELGNCNASAQNWIDWTDANRLVARLSIRGGGPNTEADRTLAVEALSEMANHNPHARAALFAILTAGHTGELYLGRDGQFPTVPDLSHLSPAQRHGLMDRIARTTERLVQANPELGAGEAAALAIAYGRARGADTPLAVRINSILERAWQNPLARARIMDGLYVAMMQQPPVAGRREIADLYLRHADHPAFAEYVGSIADAAQRGDTTAMYVIAGALGRTENRADVVSILERSVSSLAARPDRASLFIQALRDRYHQAGDQSSLLATLGRVAASTTGGISPALRGQVLGELRDAINSTFNPDGTIDGAARPTYASALRGMAPLAAHWTHPADFNALTRRFTPELVSTLREAGRGVSNDMADRILALAMQRGRTLGDQQVPALDAIGALSRHVTPEQVTQLGAMIRDLPPADLRIQQAASRTLLQIINNITEIVNDTRNATEPAQVQRRNSMIAARDAAVNFFTETGWAQGMGDQVRQALLNYARGEAVDPAYVGRITELGYDMYLRPPISHVLRTMGIEGIPPAQLQAAIERVGGEQRFRDLLSRIQAYDALPAPLQRLVREGRTDISAIQPLDLSPAHGGRTTRTDLRALITHLQTQGLEAGAFTHLGQACQTNLDNLRAAVLSQIAQRAGLGDWETASGIRESRERALTGRAPRIEDGEARAQDRLRARTMDRLCEMTADARGTSALWLLLGTPGLIYRQISVSNLETQQAQLITDLSTQSQAAARARGEMGRLQGVMQSLDIAGDTARVFGVLQDGDRRRADVLILQMASEHSVSSLQMVSPGIHSQLVGFGPAAWQQGVWGRLARHQAATGIPMPTYRNNTPEVVEDACATLVRRDLRVGGDGQYHELSYYAHQLLVHEALRALDTAPGTTRATSAAAEFSVEASDLQRLIAAGISGHRGDEFVAHIRGLVRRNGPQLSAEEVTARVATLNRQLETTTNPQTREVLQRRIRDLERNGREDLGLQPAIERIQSELPEMRRSLHLLEEARRTATDPDAIRGLDARIQAMRGVVDTFSPNSAQMRQFNEMFRLVNSGSFDASTIWRTLRDNAIPILLTIACAAAIIATCGTASVLMVVVGAALMSVSGLAINEGFAELSYQLDWNGTGGSQLGNAVRRWEQQNGMRDSGYMVYDYRTGRMIPGPTFGDAFKHYGIHLTKDFLMNLGLMGFGHLLGSSLRWATGAGREATQLQSLGRVMDDAGRRATGLARLIGENPATQRWVSTFLHECRGQVGFALVQDATHTALVRGFNEQNFWTELAAGLICCAGHTTMTHFQHYGIRPRMLREGVLELPIDRETFMREMRRRINPGEIEGVTMRENPLGTVDVTINGRPIEIRFVRPEVAIANAQAARLAEGHGNGQPSDHGAVPPGRPHGFETRRQEAPSTHATELDTTHSLSERARTARGQMDGWVDHASQGRFGEATEHALNCAEQLRQQHLAEIHFNNVDIPIGTLTERLPQHLDAMGGPAGDRGRQPHATGTPDHVDIHLSRPRLVLEGGVTVDLTRLSTERARLTEPQRQALDNALNTPAGQAILRRAALQYMEEIIVHSNHILSDGRLSFIQAQFDALVTNPPGGRRDGAILREWQAHGADAHGEGFSAVRAEQEVLALMYERGAPWDLIMAVARNSSHVTIREHMLTYLRGLEAGHAPAAVPPPPRLPGSPTTPHASERSGLPRRLFEGEAEISNADRQLMRDQRQQLHDQINAQTNIPPAIREILIALLPVETHIAGDRAAVRRAANDLTVVGDIMRLPHDIRAHFLDAVIARMEAPTAAQLNTARFAHELAQAGVPTERITALTPEHMDQIRIEAEGVPANVRRAFIDPVLSQVFDQAAFRRALRDARAVAGETDPVARLDLMARRGRGSGAEVEGRARLLHEMMAERLADYRTALGTPAESRTPEHQRILDAFNRARGALGINHHVFEAFVVPAVNAPTATEATMRAALERARQYSEAATARGITSAHLEAAFQLPAHLREMIVDPLLQRTSTPTEFAAETAIAARYAERGLSTERLNAIRDLPVETRRAFIDPVVTGESFSAAAFDTAAGQARTYHTAPLDGQITSLRDRIGQLETRTRSDDNPLSASEREQLRTTREALAERLRRAEARLQEIADLTRPRTAEEQRLSDSLTAQQAGQRLLSQNAVDQATLARMTAEQINNVAALDPGIRTHFMGEILAGRRGFEHFAESLTAAREFSNRPIEAQMRELRSQATPLESRLNSTTSPLTPAEIAQLRSTHDLLFNRLQHASREIQRLEAITNRTAEQNTALERSRTALREQIAHLERRCDIGNTADSGSIPADIGAMETHRLITAALQRIERAGGYSDFAVIRTRSGSAMDGVGYDFLIIDRRTGRFIAVDASARNKVGDGDYTGVRMRENAVVHVPQPATAAERARLLEQVHGMIQGIPNSPLSLGDIRMPFDQAHTAPTVRRLTPTEIQTIREQVNAERVIYERAMRSWENNGRRGPEPLPRNITLPSGEIVPVPPAGGDPQIALRRETGTSDTRRETTLLTNIMSGTGTGNGAQVAARLEQAIAHAAPYVQERLNLTEGYMRDLAAREQALRQEGRLAEARDLARLRDQIERGAHTHAQDLVRDLARAREALEAWRNSQGPGGAKGPTTTPPTTTPPTTQPATPPPTGGPTRPARTLHEGAHETTATPATIAAEINQSSLPESTRNVLSRYAQAHPESAPLMQRAARVAHEHLAAAGVERAVVSDSATAQRIELAVRHAEVLAGIERMPEGLREGLRQILTPEEGRSRPGARQIGLIEDIIALGHERIPETVRRYLEDPSLLDADTIRGLRTMMRQAVEAHTTQQPAAQPAEQLTAARRRALLGERFSECHDLSVAFSPETINRAQTEAARILAEHMPGAIPQEVNCGSNQIAITLLHPDGRRTVLKFDTRGTMEWRDTYGTREFDCPIIRFGGRGVHTLGSGSDRWVAYQQPYGTPPTQTQIAEFNRLLARGGRQMGDGGVVEADSSQIRVINGRPRLIDYDAVRD